MRNLTSYWGPGLSATRTYVLMALHLMMSHSKKLGALFLFSRSPRRVENQKKKLKIEV